MIYNIEGCTFKFDVFNEKVLNGHFVSNGTAKGKKLIIIGKQMLHKIFDETQYETICLVISYKLPSVIKFAYRLGFKKVDDIINNNPNMGRLGKIIRMRIDKEAQNG